MLAFLRMEGITEAFRVTGNDLGNKVVMEKKISTDVVREFRGKQSIGWVVIFGAMLLCGVIILVFSSKLLDFGLILSGIAASFLSGMKYKKASREILFRVSETELSVFWKGQEWHYPRDQLTVSFYAPRVWAPWLSSHDDIICSIGTKKDRFPDMLSRNDRFEFLGLITRLKSEEAKEKERFLPAIERILNGGAIEYELRPEHHSRAVLRLNTGSMLFWYGMPLAVGVAGYLFTAAPPEKIVQGIGLLLLVIHIPGLVRCFIGGSPSTFSLLGLIRYRVPSRLRLDMDSLTVNGKRIPFASVSSITLGISAFDRQRTNSFALLVRRRRKPIAPNITLRLGIAFENGDPDATVFPRLEEFIAVLSIVCKKRPLPFKIIKVNHPLAKGEYYPKGFPQ